MVFTPVTELFLNGAWVPITSDVRQADGIQITRGRSAEAETADPSSCSLTIDNTSGDYSPRNPEGAHYGQLGRNAPLRVLSPSSNPNYLALPGDLASYVSTPDVAALDITGDIDIRVDVDLQTWRPPNQYGLARKWTQTSVSSSGSWAFDLRADGTLRFYWATAGFFVSTLDAQSTVAVPSSSTRLAVRVTLDVNNGAAGRDIRFYTSTTGVDGTWTQLGSTVTQAGTTSIFSGLAQVEVGRTVDGSSLEGDIPSAIQGRVYAFQMRSGIGGTVVANADFTAQDSGISGFTDSAGRVWALNGSAVMVNPDARFHGELAALPSRWDKTGRDRYVPVEASGVLRRLGQGQTALKSVMYRSLTTSPGIVAYWPCEDGSGSTELASALPGHSTMHLWGDVDTASFDGFAASEALPTASGVQWWGAVSPYSITGLTQVSFLLAVPAGGVASISQICGIRTSGSALRWEVHVNPAGDMRLQAFNSGDIQIEDSGYVASFAANGKLLRVSVRLDHTGSDVDWSLTTDEVGSSTQVSVLGTLVGRTIGRIRWITMNVGGVLTDTALGHITVHTEFQGFSGTQLAAYTGESATARVLRLCQEEGVPVTIVGDITDAALLGPQLPAQLLDLLREAAASDLGILYEPRGHLGLGYRTRVSLYAQDATLTLDYTAETLSGIEPVEDDDAVRNDITVRRVLGSSARAELTSGPLSVQAPPDGVGRYDEEVEISLSRDDDLPGQASWRLHLGTVDEARYPLLGVNLANAAFTAGLSADAVALDVGDRLVVTDLPAGLGAPDDIQQIAQGFTETITPFEWLIGVNCTPASPWDVGRWDDSAGPGEARYSSDGTTLMAGAALLLNGTSPGRASTPDTAVLDITGDLDIRVHVAMDDWTPAANQSVCSKWISAGQRSFIFQVTTTGAPRLFWTADGSTNLSATATAAPSISNGEALWVRVTLDVNNGAAGRDITFYTSTDGATWTQLGSTVTQAGVTSIFASTTEVAVGANDSGTTDRLAGRVFSAEIRSGISGTIVANPDFGAQAAGATSFADSTGKTWTVISPAVIDGAAIAVLTPTGPVWGTADLPYDLAIGGERVTVTAVTGTGPAQVLTVTRSVNGVTKAQPTGSEVGLHKPAVYAL